MPSRTINLKMVLGKKEKTAQLRRALWTTHYELNNAVGQIERMLLLCRGATYRTLNANDEEVRITEGEVVAQALTMAREAQKLNGKEGTGSDEEILTALRQMYEQIVPSCLLDQNGNPLKGDAQASNAWVSPLMDRESKGGLSVYDKVLDPPPEWVKMKNENKPGWEEKSRQWLDTDEAKRLQSATGSPPGWVRNLRKGLPWQEVFILDQEKKRKELEAGNGPVIKRLQELGLLPLLSPTLRLKIKPNGKGVSRWDRLATRLAVAHLLSWESWNHSTKKAHDEAKARYDNLKAEYKRYEDQFKALRQYEVERHQELKKVASADDNRPFKIGARAVRAWSQVREEWLKKGSTEEARKQILKNLQTALRGKFGDPDLFLWLAKDGREHLWQEADVLIPLVKLNEAQRKLEKRKPNALMTFAEPRFHPRWTMFEAPGGTNLRNYNMVYQNSELYVKLDLLQVTENGGLAEKEFQILLAPSDQFSDLTFSKDEKKTRVKYRSAHEEFAGELGGAEILFHRLYLEHPERSEQTIAQGSPGPVWFKLTLNVDSKAPNEWLNREGKVTNLPELHHFNTAHSKKSKHAAKLQPGLRVLSVDLGMRTFASCSVFQLVKGKPKDGLYFPTADDRSIDDPEKLWAKHERSFKLSLPGEILTKSEKEARKKAEEEIRSLRVDIRRLKDILRLSIVEENEKRDALIQSLIDSLNDQPENSGFNAAFIEKLNNPKFKFPLKLWEQHCLNIYNEAEKLVSKRFSEWRKRTRPKSSSWQDWRERRAYAGGKSIWMIEYLEAVRRLIMSWNLRGRIYGQINRQDKKLHGLIASRLLDHINKLKEDRLKAGADMIIQAARGYIPSKDGGGWTKKFEPCRVILFEDLARYRFRLDRPRRENSQLMKWNHRKILEETTMQAELYRMAVTTTAAGFTSRYLAATGTPGVRCRYLTHDDFENDRPKPYVVFELEWMLGKNKYNDLTEKQNALKDKIKPGILVPWNGGEMFASVKPDGKLHLIHADINAAQNLQRRFWNRCSEAFRITCEAITINGRSCYKLSQPPGSRLLGALQKLEHGHTQFYLEDERENKRYVMKPFGGKMKMKAEKETHEEDDWDDVIMELEKDHESTRTTFFRDPSGILFDPRYWVPSKQYWAEVKTKVWSALRKQ